MLKSWYCLNHLKGLVTDFTWEVNGTASSSGIRFTLSGLHFPFPVAATVDFMVWQRGPTVPLPYPRAGVGSVVPPCKVGGNPFKLITLGVPEFRSVVSDGGPAGQAESGQPPEIHGTRTGIHFLCFGNFSFIPPPKKKTLFFSTTNTAADISSALIMQFSPYFHLFPLFYLIIFVSSLNLNTLIWKNSKNALAK